MTTRAFLVGTTVAVVLAGVPVASAAATDHDARLWMNVTAQGSVKPGTPWKWHVDIQQRNRDAGSEPDQLVLRPAVGFALSDRTSVSGGYAYTLNFAMEGDVTEHRLWQQHLWTIAAGVGTVAFRTRLEQRFFEGVDGVAWRVREQVRYQRPIRRSRFEPIVWDELLVHPHGTSRARRGFDQNRAFAGIGISVNAKVRVDAGYMNQFRKTIEVNQMNHVLSTVVNLHF